MFWILLAIISICMIVIGVWQESQIKDGSGFGMAGVLILILIILITSITYLSNLQKIYQLEADYFNLTGQYQCAITDTQAILSIQPDVSSNIVDGSVEKIGVGNNIATQIVNLRDQISEYNITLITMKLWKQNIWFGITVPDINPELKPIKMNVFNNKQ